MTRKTLVASTYVTAAGLLLAMGAAAHYFKGGPGHSTTTENTGKTQRGMMSGQMSQGMMGKNRNMMEARERMRGLVRELTKNQRAMDKARSMRSIKPLLRKNGELLDRLSDEMSRSWGTQHSMRGATSGRRASSGKSQSRTAAKPSRSTAGSAAHERLVAEGKEVFRADGCRVCHGSSGKGTAVGPSLVGIGKKYSAEKLAHLIRHPATARMPAFSESALPEAKLKAVVAFLQTLH